MNKNELQVGTAVDKRTAAESGTSASLEQNGLLSDAGQEGDELIDKFLNPKTGGSTLSLRVLQYRSSWDWLMCVIEKIESIKSEDGDYLFSVDTGRDYCLIYHNDFIQRTISVKSFSGSKIKSAWLAVVEFIKWYNVQNNKSA